METEDFDKKRIDYIFGDLSKEEEAIYKEELKQNPEEFEEIELQKKIIYQRKLDIQLDNILSDPGFEQAEIEAEKAVNDYTKRQRREFLLSKTFWRKHVYTIAASFLVFLYLGNLSIFLISPELAFEKYYKDYSPVYYAEATINEAQVLLTHSLDEYNQGNYEAVAENMRTLMGEGELNVRGQIMLAFYDAWKKPLFDNFKTKKTTEEDATWYLALAAYKLHDLQIAQDLFSKLSSERSLRGWRAARMERKISKMVAAE